MRVELLQYDLPVELIAQRPAERRDLARLMHLPPSGGAPEHKSMGELPELLPAGALVVVNDTRVIAARLLGRKRDTGGRVEVFLLRHVGVRDMEVEPAKTRRASIFRALGKSSKPLRFGSDVDVLPRERLPGTNAAGLVVRLLGRSEDDGLLEVALFTPDGSPVEDAVRACGRVPLPPDLRRGPDAGAAARDQRVNARHEGAVAAPTAGLHLSEAMLSHLAASGCELATVTLHVGLGTFQPVVAADFSEHSMHAEPFAVPPTTADAIARARSRGKPVVAIGTTTVRALESAADPSSPGLASPRTGDTRLLIQPGHAWRVVDGLLTNFHLPGSTLLALVCAFAGVDRVMSAYRAAVDASYRFYSYGDGMLLWRDGA